MSSSGDEVLAQKTHGDDRVVVTQTLHAFAQGGSIITFEAGVTGTVLEAGATGTVAIVAAFDIEGIGTCTAGVPLSALNMLPNSLAFRHIGDGDYLCIALEINSPGFAALHPKGNAL